MRAHGRNSIDFWHACRKDDAWREDPLGNQAKFGYDEAATLAGAVLKILGPVEIATPPAALFALPSTTRLGLTIGR